MKHLILSLFILFSWCLTTAQEISFESDVRYRKAEENNFSDLKKSETLKIKKGENALIISKTGLPILIYSPIDENSQVKISEAQMQTIMKEQLQTDLNSSTNEIIDGLRKTEALLQKREFSQALISISNLKNSYPRISSVLFLSATVQYLSNNKATAIEDLNAGLAIDPQNTSAQKLLSELKGSSR